MKDVSSVIGVGFVALATTVGVANDKGFGAAKDAVVQETGELMNIGSESNFGDFAPGFGNFDHSRKNELEEINDKQRSEIYNLLESVGSESEIAKECKAEEKTCERNMDKSENCSFLPKETSSELFYRMHNKVAGGRDSEMVENCKNDVREKLNACLVSEIACLKK